MRRLLYAMLHLSRPLLASAGVCFVLGVVPVTVLTQTSRTVMGTVTDDTGTGLPGVTVLQQGTTYGLTPPTGPTPSRLFAGPPTPLTPGGAYAIALNDESPRIIDLESEE